MGLKQIFSTGVYSFYFVFINNSLMRGNLKKSNLQIYMSELPKIAPDTPQAKNNPSVIF